MLAIGMHIESRSDVDDRVRAGIAKAEETSRLASTNARLALEKQDQWTTRIAVIEDRMNRKGDRNGR
jgi:hypothetical protein